jgi:hypothetical protein
MFARLISAASACLIAGATLAAQDHPTRSPISIGNYPNVSGLRINFRDDRLERVTGVNITVWSPYEPASGLVKGIAIGLPLTGAQDVVGLGVGLLGVGADRDVRGVMFGPIGVGAGRNLKGIGFGGIGAGAGGNIDGIFLGGIGAGAGGNGRGILLGGIGAGMGGRFRGAAIGGIGVGAGGDFSGFAAGGIGVGAGGNFRGIGLGGVGVGAGGNVTGFVVGGIGVGAGGTLRGVAVGGVGVGAPRIEGVVAALAAGAKDARALVIAPGYFKIEREGSFTGVSFSSVNYVRGSVNGLTVGLLNYARSLHGMQLGLINVIADQKEHPVLPLLNWGAR